MKHIFVIDERDNDFFNNPSKIKNMKKEIIDKTRKYDIRPEFISKKPSDNRLLSNIINEVIWKYDDDCLIYSVGSNAILNCVLNGVVGTNAILGIIPTENNNFYRTLSNNNKNILDRTIHSAVDSTQTLDIDVGILNRRYFLNSITFGYYAELLNDRDMNARDRITYFQKLKALLNYKSKDLHISFDEVLIRGNILSLVIMNGHFIDKDINISNNAVLNDGYFDIAIARDIEDRFKLIRDLSNGISYTTKIDKEDPIYLLREDSINVVTPQKVLCNVDGIMFEDRSFNIRRSSEKVKVLLPKIK